MSFDSSKILRGRETATGDREMSGRRDQGLRTAGTRGSGDRAKARKCKQIEEYKVRPPDKKDASRS